MFRIQQLFSYFLRTVLKTGRASTPPTVSPVSVRPLRLRQWRSLLLIALIGFGCVGFTLVPAVVQAQSSDRVEQAEDQVIRQFSLPSPPRQRPTYQPKPAAPSRPSSSPRRSARPATVAPAPAAAPSPAPAEAPSAAASPAPAPAADKPNPPTAPQTSQYIWEFNRSPQTGNRLRLKGVYPEVRLGFTKPQNWQIKSAKAIVRFRQSPSLLAERSHLTLRVNDTTLGSVPLDRSNSEVGQAEFEIPSTIIYEQNELLLLAEQQTSEDCTNPNLPTLWTEVQPDSRLVFNYVPQDVALDFSRYPYPFVDEFSLEPNALAYLRPKTVNSDWLTASSRFQVGMSQLFDARLLSSRTIDTVDDLQSNERLIVIGLPADQPLLDTLSLPLPLDEGQFLDANQQPLPDDVGVLIMATAKNGSPVLVATGNGPMGVNKAVQFLVQPDRELGTGVALLVTNLDEPPSPDPRDWMGYLPTQDQFSLRDLMNRNRTLFEDVTVRGSNAPAVEIPFRSLPDEQIRRGSTMTLHYSYSPQLNPKTSAVEVVLDGVSLGAKQLSSNGGDDTLTVNLSNTLVNPNSLIQVRFLLQPREAGVCGLKADQQLWGTVHADSRFNLSRTTMAKLPSLKLLATGYPLTAPQDLSTTAIALPNDPTPTELETLLRLNERLGRISHADAVKVQVYVASDVNDGIKKDLNIVGIGTRDRFPFPQAMETKGFDLGSALLRQFGTNSVQAVNDDQGVVKAVLSPWNTDHVLLALTGQTEQGLKDVQDLLSFDRLFGQLEGDTVLVSRNTPNPSPYNVRDYTLQFLQQAPRQHTVVQTNLLNRIVLFLQNNWWVIPVVFILIALLLYGFSQIYLNRVADSGGSR